jgi:hypothetical protein
MISNYTCLILTHVNKTTGELLLPHLLPLLKNNPKMSVHVVIGEDHPFGKRYNWRNADQALRKWWIENGSLVATNCVAIIEWDTLVNCAFPEIPFNLDLVGKQMFVEPLHLKNQWVRKRMSDLDWHQDYWYWWGEIPKLKLMLSERAVGLISLGCFLTKKWVLDSIARPQWDEAYRQDIISELRLPTIASIEGARIGEINLPFVDYNAMIFSGEKEIFHPIKESC